MQNTLDSLEKEGSASCEGDRGNPSFEGNDHWINGRTLQMAMEVTRANRTFKPFQPTDRVPIDPRKDAYLLGAELKRPFPFSTGSGLMMTVHDVDNSEAVVYEFGRFQFSASAYESALHWMFHEDKITDEVECLGQQVLSDAPDAAYEFSRRVCEWGRGARVWGNLNRFHTQAALTQELRAWFSSLESVQDDDAIAVERGVSIKGLGVSFASKHLRFLKPDRYGVLDEVLSLGLGFALNPAGYALFMYELRRFKHKHQLSHSIAQVEASLFGLVRQSVRGQSPDDSSSLS